MNDVRIAVEQGCDAYETLLGPSAPWRDTIMHLVKTNANILVDGLLSNIQASDTASSQLKYFDFFKVEGVVNVIV